MPIDFTELSPKFYESQEEMNRLNHTLRTISDNIPGDTNNVKDFTGYGSPESVISASIGSTYRRIDGGSSTTQYTKESGTGNTGWVASLGGTYPVPIGNGGTGQTTALAAFNALCPTGFILIWSGSSASIPSGWLLCNGSNGTPDLRDKFIVGAGSTYAVGATGGATSGTPTIAAHTLTTAEIPSHNHASGTIAVSGTAPTHDETAVDATPASVCGVHSAPNGTIDLTLSVSGSTATTGDGGSHTHTPGAVATLPPYYALCYIMKS